MVKTYSETLTWEVIFHLPYCPDVAPTITFARWEYVGVYEEVEKLINSWITLKAFSFFDAKFAAQNRKK